MVQKRGDWATVLAGEMLWVFPDPAQILTSNGTFPFQGRIICLAPSALKTFALVSILELMLYYLGLPWKAGVVF